MNASDLTLAARISIVLLCLFALLLWTVGVTAAEPPPPRSSSVLVERLVELQRSLPTRKGDAQTDPRALAEAIAEASKGDRTIAAAVLATGWIESTLSDRLRRNECRKHECDGGRAWGLFQQHKDGFSREAWGSPDERVQAQHAARRMRFARNTCRAAGAPFPEGMLRQYGGRNCNSTALPREALRVATFNRIRARL